MTNETFWKALISFAVVAGIWSYWTNREQDEILWSHSKLIANNNDIVRELRGDYEEDELEE